MAELNTHVTLPIVQVETKALLHIGDWCVFIEKFQKSTRNTTTIRLSNNNNCFNNYIVGRILSFSYLKGTTKNKQYSLENAPTFAEPSISNRGLGCLCTWYYIETDGVLTHSPVFRHGFCDIKHYQFSIPSPALLENFDNNGQKMETTLKLKEETLTVLKLKLDQQKTIYKHNSGQHQTKTENFENNSDSETSDDEHDMEIIDTSDGEYVEEDGEDEAAEDDNNYFYKRVSSINQEKQDIVNTVKIKTENYYAVFYDTCWYVGRVTGLVDKKTSRIKFLKKSLGKYKWPKHDDIQLIDNQYIFYGPISLLGNGPFTLKEDNISTINAIFTTMKKSLL